MLTNDKVRAEVDKRVGWFLSETDNLWRGKPSICWWAEAVCKEAGWNTTKMVEELFILAKEVLDETQPTT